MATGQRGDDGYVFAKPDGSPIHPNLISQTFERAVAKFDIPRIRLRDLRHTHATILLRQNRVVQHRRRRGDRPRPQHGGAHHRGLESGVPPSAPQE